MSHTRRHHHQKLHNKTAKNLNKFPYLSLKTINKYEKLADEYNISRVSRGLDKSTKSDMGLLVAYKKLGKSGMLKTPIFANKSDHIITYDQLRTNWLNARMGQLKKMHIPLYTISKNGQKLPTKFHLTMIMSAYSPDKNLK